MKNQRLKNVAFIATATRVIRLIITPLLYLFKVTHSNELLDELYNDKLMIL